MTQKQYATRVHKFCGLINKGLLDNTTNNNNASSRLKRFYRYSSDSGFTDKQLKHIKENILDLESDRRVGRRKQ